MRLRRLVSLTALLTFILLVLTGVILYLVPQGRVAYWSGWTLWGFSKTQWTSFHINLALLFLIAGVLHIYYNWSAITAYLRDRMKRMVVVTREFVMALLICLLFVLATHFALPPFQWVLDLGDSIKDAGAVRYGEPPYGHAELSTLQTFARRVDLDLAPALDRLRAAGIQDVDASRTLEELAAANRTTPQALYGIMQPPAAEAPGVPPLPAIPPPGTGRLTLSEFCARHDLDPAATVVLLQTQGIEGALEQTLREVGEQNGTSPDEIYERIRAGQGD